MDSKYSEKDDYSISSSSLRSSMSIDAKQQSRNSQPATPSKTSTWKSILTGDVHKHNPRLKLEESVSNPMYGRGR
ncbi:MAG: hypothetical protein M1821_003017 [Bathelium mastoideum]|nr:MAG: hypothetical protein M1821_003017 [Bathelium mastoideum]